jgi:uncharacterized protein YndB with AHSA1/START domain
MQPPEGDPFHLTGEFREVDPPTRLAYTFRWEPPDPDDVETLAEFTFRDLGGSTGVTLRQGAPRAPQGRVDGVIRQARGARVAGMTANGRS